MESDAHRRHEIVAKFHPEICWESDFVGFIPCPGKSRHTTRTKSHDCAVFLNSVPTIFCWHSSCKAEVERANFALRSAISKNEPSHFTRSNGGLSEDERKRISQKQHLMALSERAKSACEMILNQNPWSPELAKKESPVSLPEAVDGWRGLLKLFKPDDTIWIGNIYDSGKAVHSKNFRTVSEWQTCRNAPNQFTCPSTFQKGSFCRGNAMVENRRYLVVESDTLTKPEICAIFKWCAQFMSLRAIVDTGGKSLHGWFDYPKADVLEELKAILPALGCDPALFKASQPCRLPGAKRGDKWQQLIWFGGIQ